MLPAAKVFDYLHLFLNNTQKTAILVCQFIHNIAMMDIVIVAQNINIALYLVARKIASDNHFSFAGFKPINIQIAIKVLDFFYGKTFAKAWKGSGKMIYYDEIRCLDIAKHLIRH